MSNKSIELIHTSTLMQFNFELRKAKFIFGRTTEPVIQNAVQYNSISY